MTYDVAIVGGGIIGLATARELLRRHRGLNLVLLEKDDRLAGQQTGHNSGVIHSGIYYAPDSLKSRLCTEGRKALWTYCETKGIEYRNVGKLIVATEQRELPSLDALYRRGLAAGIDGLQLIDGPQIARYEPYCAGLQAIYSPVTGIVDYGHVARAYADDARDAGAEIRTGFQVDAIKRSDELFIIRGGGAEIASKRVITCAGLQSDRVARMSGGAADPKIVPFRGDYLVLRPERRHLVKANIYPVPDPALPFLGAHFTPRIGGDVWLGPNAVLAFAREGYSVDRVDVRDLFETLTYPGFLKFAAGHMKTAVTEFYRDVVHRAYVKQLQRYVPQLRVEDTLPGPSGVRAQCMQPNGSLVDDFVFDGTGDLLHVRNAPSPAATSSLAIARHIVDTLEQRTDLRRSVAV